MKSIEISYCRFELKSTTPRMTFENEQFLPHAFLLCLRGWPLSLRVAKGVNKDRKKVVKDEDF